MLAERISARTLALRVGLLELLIVLAGLIFVRKEIYLAGQFKSMLLHWQEYALLVLMFIDGVLRGFGEYKAQGQYLSPFRKRILRYFLPFTLFLFVSCASLCDRVNVVCIQQEWWRDAGLLILVSGVFLSGWEQKTRPKELEIKVVDEVDFQPELSTAGGDRQTEISSGSGGDTGSETGAVSGSENGAVTGSETGAVTDSETGAVTDSETGAVSGSENPDSSEDAEIQADGPWKLLRYPDRSSILLELVGVSMAISAYLPLLTLPGLIVAFKWELADLEAFRISQLGEKYIRYKSKTWFLIPYIY